MTPEDLVEIELIKRLKYKYMRCLDQKLWDVVGECFTPDATASYSGGVYSFEGRDAIVEFLRTSMGSTTMLTSHRCHHPEIDLDEDRAGANGTWAFEDTVILTDVGVTVQGAAFYHDRYVKDEGELADRAHRVPQDLRRAGPAGVDRRAQGDRRLVGDRRAIEPRLSCPDASRAYAVIAPSMITSVPFTWAASSDTR